MMESRLVYIASPYAGDIERNVACVSDDPL